MMITFLLVDIKEIDAKLANFLFENGFDDSTPYSSEGKSFISLEDEYPPARLQQLIKLGINAEIFEVEDKKEQK